MASAMDAMNNILGLDKVNMNGRMLLIEERHGSNANFALNCVISNSIKQNLSLCLVLFHNTFGHYHNIGMRLGYKLNTLRDKGQVTVVEPMKLIASNIDNFCNNSGDSADCILIKPTLETNMDMVRKLVQGVKEEYSRAAKYNETVVIIVDDLNHLHDLGLSLRDSMYYVRYLKSLAESHKTMQLCILTHSYGEDPHYSDSDALANGLKYMAHLFITMEPLRTGYSRDASGKMTINWRIDSVRREYHWAESVTYLYKLMDWQVKAYAPGKRFSFCDAYPQYVKFYTLDARLPLGYNTRITAKFTAIMETLGYLMLDFYNRPKQLDRLVGYIAMVHKDMHLDKQDIFNFGSHLLKYLADTFPTTMTVSCNEVLTKYFNSILEGIITKMEYFRNCEKEEAASQRRSFHLMSCSRCTFFRDNLVYGQTKHYWKDRKKQWDMRLNEWMTNGPTALESALASSTDEEDASVHKDKTSNGKLAALEPRRQSRAASILAQLPVLDLSNPSASRLALLTLSKRLESRGTDLSVEGGGGSLADAKKDEKSATPTDTLRISRGEGSTPRERYRARSLARDAWNPRGEATVLRRRVRSSRIAVTPRHSRISPVSEEDNCDDPQQRESQTRRFSSTARERRRETQHFSFDLK